MRNEITEIIPFNEFGNLDDLDFSDNAAFDGELQLLQAPELDDMHDTDDLIALRLDEPHYDRTGSGNTTHSSPYRSCPQDVNVVDTVERRGQHRKPVTGVAKGRVLITAMAAGAAAAAAHSAIHPSNTATAQTVLAADEAPHNSGPATTPTRGMQLVTVKLAANNAVHNEALAKGVAFAEERAQREARLQRPLFVTPTSGIFTSNFGYRWGALHAGIDIANSIGTTIVAVSDGVVIEAGPSAGYGMLVKLRHSDGTVTLYGHVNSTTVDLGERVMAGDQIATMGNRGYSTGPHLHFEVMLNGSNRVDPLPWLAKRGINVGNFAG